MILALLAAPVEGAAKGSTNFHRSRPERCAFLLSQGVKDCRTPPGMTVDHVIAIACGGWDSRWNMQLQTVAEAKAKDRWERKYCNGRE